MAAYVISEVEVLDPALIEKYRTLHRTQSPDTMANTLSAAVVSNQSRPSGVDELGQALISEVYLSARQLELGAVKWR